MIFGSCCTKTPRNWPKNCQLMHLLRETMPRVEPPQPAAGPAHARPAAERRADAAPCVRPRGTLWHAAGRGRIHRLVRAGAAADAEVRDARDRGGPAPRA